MATGGHYEDEFFDISDTSSPTVTDDLYGSAATSLHATTAASQPKNPSSGSSGLPPQGQVVLEAYPSRDDGVSDVSFRPL